MTKVTHIFMISGIAFASPVAAQVSEPGPQDSPSAATVAACNAQVADRWATMAPADRAKRSKQELIRTCTINLEIANYASAQNRIIVADQQQAAAARLEHDAAVAKYKASKSAWEAEVRKQKDDYAARHARWEADAAACLAGDRSKCAPRD